MRPAHNKRACVCGHGITIHRRSAKDKTAACHYPGCGCKQYTPAKRA